MIWLKHVYMGKGWTVFFTPSVECFSLPSEIVPGQAWCWRPLDLLDRLLVCSSHLGAVSFLVGGSFVRALCLVPFAATPYCRPDFSKPPTSSLDSEGTPSVNLENWHVLLKLQPFLFLKCVFFFSYWCVWVWCSVCECGACGGCNGASDPLERELDGL